MMPNDCVNFLGNKECSLGTCRSCKVCEGETCENYIPVEEDENA